MSHSYPSDISREQFTRILPDLESARRRTKPRTVDLYSSPNAASISSPLAFRTSSANPAAIS